MQIYLFIPIFRSNWWCLERFEIEVSFFECLLYETLQQLSQQYNFIHFKFFMLKNMLIFRARTSTYAIDAKPKVVAAYG